MGELNLDIPYHKELFKYTQDLIGPKVIKIGMTDMRKDLDLGRPIRARLWDCLCGGIRNQLSRSTYE